MPASKRNGACAARVLSSRRHGPGHLRPALGVQCSGERVLRLLLIDDSELVLRAMRRLLRRDYIIVTAANGLEALELIQSGERFDVILCDVAMPVMNGVEFYKELLARHPELAEGFVFATGGAQTLRSMGYLLDTRVRVLLKPVKGDALRDAVEAAAMRAASAVTRRIRRPTTLA
jgi:CheY-like chemotaxis protein